MPRRTLLSADQRARLFAIPTDRAETAKHYVLGPEDLELVRSKRRAVNRLGFAAQLCLLRHPGQGLGPGEHPPAPVLAFVAAQLGLPPALFAEYARRDQTRREHAAELQAALGLRGFPPRLARLLARRQGRCPSVGSADCCSANGSSKAMATDRGEPIVQAVLSHLRVQGMVVPSTAVLERIGLMARACARRHAFVRLAEGLGEAERAALDGLLAPALGIGPERAARVHPARLSRLVDEAGIMTVQHHRAAIPWRDGQRS